jgi:hypothetical protein
MMSDFILLPKALPRPVPHAWSPSIITLDTRMEGVAEFCRLQKGVSRE